MILGGMFVVGNDDGGVIEEYRESVRHRRAAARAQPLLLPYLHPASHASSLAVAISFVPANSGTAAAPARSGAPAATLPRYNFSSSTYPSTSARL